MTNQIQSGVGDRNDLLAKMPSEENGVKETEHGIILEGTIDKQHNVYPEIHFDLGVQYEGRVLDTYNEGEIEVGMVAHPEVCVPYTVKQTKELPIDRVWEAEAIFEAEVDITEMEYAVFLHGSYIDTIGTPVGWKIEWAADAGSKSVANARDILASNSKDSWWVGTGSPTQYIIKNNTLMDENNISEPAGVIAKNLTDMENVEVTLTFKTIKDNLKVKPGHTEIKQSHFKTSSGFVKDPGVDDDIVGVIFGARSNTDFYCLLWEGEKRTFIGGRSPASIDGMKLSQSMHGWAGPGTETKGKPWESHHGWKLNPDGSLPPFPTPSQWDAYSSKTGWGTQHRRIYRVKDGVFRRVDVNPSGRHGGADGYDSSTYDLGSGQGWIFGKTHGVKIEMYEENVKIYLDGQEAFDFDVDPANAQGSYGVMNISQAVEFHTIETKSRKIIRGEIPKDETGQEWGIVESGLYTVTEKKLSFIRGRKDFQNKAKKYNANPQTIPIIMTKVKLNNGNNGRIVTGEEYSDSPVVIEAFTENKEMPFSLRKPANNSVWDSWKGIGKKEIAKSAKEYFEKEVHAHLVKEFGSDYSKDAVIYSGAEGVVKDSETGIVHIKDSRPDVPIIIETYNPPDAGEILRKRHLHCDVATITPDHRDEDSCYVVFHNIEMLFIDQKLDFFSRDDLINEKEYYDLVYPEPQEEPKPEELPIGDEITFVTEGGCSVEGIIIPEEICWRDFDFDGKKLCMWSCEFPIEENILDFKACAAKFQGVKEFNPINDFIHNDWSQYQLFFDQKSVHPEYDRFGWRSTDNDTVEMDIITLETERYYVGLMDPENKRIRERVYLETKEDKNIHFFEIPSAPTQFVHPRVLDSQMPHYESDIHYFAKIYDKHPDIDVRWTRFDPETDEFLASHEPEWLDDDLLKLSRVKRVTQIKTEEGEIVEVTPEENKYLDFHYRLRALIKEAVNTRPWNSGINKMKLSVNGQNPLIGKDKGKKNLEDVDLMFVDFPKNIIKSTIKGPKVIVVPRDDLNPEGAKITYKINKDKATFSSNYKEVFIEKIPYSTNPIFLKGPISATKKPKKVLSLPSPKKDFEKEMKTTLPSTFKLEKIKFLTRNPFVLTYAYPHSSIEGWIRSFNNNKKDFLDVYAVLKDTAPLNWSPLIHNGYYYLKDRESFLYAKMKDLKLKRRKNKIKEVKPQQGAPVLVQERKEKRFIKRTDSEIDDDLWVTEKIVSSSDNQARFYLKGRGINDRSEIVYIDGVKIANTEYIIDKESPYIEFFDPIKKGKIVTVRYLLDQSFAIDMNPEKNQYSSKEEVFNIQLSKDVDPDGGDVHAIYESSKTTPFYRSDLITNPILSNKSNGFIFIDDKDPEAEEISIYGSTDYYNSERKETAAIIINVRDKYGVPVEEEEVLIYIGEEFQGTYLTDFDGSISYEADIDKSKKDNLSYIQVFAVLKNNKNIRNGVILNKTNRNKKRRFNISIETSKSLYDSDDTISVEVSASSRWGVSSGELKHVKISYLDQDMNMINQETTTISSELSIDLGKLKKGMYLIVAELIEKEDAAVDYVKIDVL